MRRLALAATATTLVTALPVLGGTPAHALSCVGADEVIADAEEVFTGRIVDARAGEVLLEVDEVWKGGPVEERVWVRVELAMWSEWAGPDGEVPDGYSSPDRWVFAPYDASVSPCTSWRLDRRIARLHAPVEPDAPVAESTADAAAEAPAPEQRETSLAAATGVGLGSGAVATGVVLALLRRRSPRRRSRRRPG